MCKKYLMKSMAFAAVAVMTASCSHNAWNQEYNPSEQTAYEFKSNFKNVVMGGNDIDANQTWSTAVTTKISIKASKAGTLKIYSQDPIGNVVAPFYTATVAKGETKSFTMARPQNVTTLYAVIYDNKGYMIDNLAFDASAAEVSAAFYTLSNSVKAPRRAIASIFEFPGDADADKFLADVPEGIKSYAAECQANNQTDQYGSGTSYVDPSWTGIVNIWGAWNGSGSTGGTLYIKGDNDFTNRKFYIAANSEIYLVEGAVLRLNAKNASDLQGGCNFYIAKNAKIIVDGNELVLNNGLHMYNHGTIEAGKLQVNRTSVLYNSSTITVDGDLSVENNQSVIVNDGTITAARLHTAGSGHMQNNGQMTISGNTDIDSNNNTWVNNGKYTTQNFNYTAGSCDVINNCYLTVTNQFHINLGETDVNGFRMDAESGVETEYFLCDGPSFIFMGSNSVFKVNETATMNITKSKYGIYGPETGDPAVFTAKEIANGAADPNQGFVANYYQNLVVATPTHFAQGYSDKSAEQQAAGEVGGQPYYYIGEGASVIETENSDIEIESTECNPGFKGGKKKKEEGKQYVYFAFEDLGTGDDFDFNDVVVRIGMPDENGKADVELCATGGTLETYVYNGSVKISKEVHEEFGWEFGTSYVDDKGNTNKNGLVTPIKKIAEVTVPEGKTVADLDINIHVINKGIENTVKRPQSGETPFCVVINGDENGKWFWPKERKNISDAYPAIGEWGANWESNPDWYLSPITKLVVVW